METQGKVPSSFETLVKLKQVDALQTDVFSLSTEKFTATPGGQSCNVMEQVSICYMYS
jgi:hypothetical protein